MSRMSRYYNRISIMGKEAWTGVATLSRQKAGTNKKYTQYRIYIPQEIGEKIKHRKVLIIIVNEEVLPPNILTPSAPQYDLITLLLRTRDVNLVPEPREQKK